MKMVYTSIKFMIFLIIIVVELKAFKQNYCFSIDPIQPQNKKFASKTGYQFIRGNSDEWHKIPGCTPTKFWLISRHGTRLPNAKNIDKMAELPVFRDEIIINYENKQEISKGALCAQDLELLRNWKWNNNITEDYDEFLVNQGWNDLKWLAQAFQKAYPALLPTNYSSSKYFFRHTNTQRTEASYKAFVDGLFGDNAYLTIPPPPISEIDMILKPQDSCSAWEEKNDIINGAGSETDLFLNSDVYTKAIKAISKRLGFKKPIKADQFKLLFEICRYEKSWNLYNNSAWCSTLLKKQISVLEYAEDIKYYYKTGYGSSINYKIACEIIADMIKRLDVKDESPAVVYFTHSVTMHLLLVGLGAVRDSVDLKSENYKKMNNRKWKSSQIGPFATNLAAIKYDCPLSAEREKVLFLLNEKPLDLDWCNNGVCNFSDVKKKYKTFTNGNCLNIYCN